MPFRILKIKFPKGAWRKPLFYFFKGEAMEQISDDELIEFMKRDFDGKCQGSI